MKKMITNSKKYFLLVNIFLIFFYANKLKASACDKDIIIIIDNSGSMMLDINWPTIKASIDDLIDQWLLQPGTKVSVVHYGSTGDHTEAKIYIESDFTSDPLIALTYVERQALVGGGDFLSESMELVGKALDAVADPNIVSPQDILNRTPDASLGIFIFTDALRDSWGFFGSALVSATDFTDPFVVFNDFKVSRGAKFSVCNVRLFPDPISEAATAAIASVGYTYAGPVEPNIGDPEGSGTTPRQQIINSTYSFDPTEVLDLVQTLNCEGYFNYIHTCYGDTTEFTSLINPTPDSLFWDFGVSGIGSDTSTLVDCYYIYPDTGEYIVTLYSWFTGIADTAVDTIHITGKFLTQLNDVNICNGTPVLLDASLDSASFLWNTGSTNDSLTTNVPGTYWVDVSLFGCTLRDSIDIGSITFTYSLGKDSSLCPGNRITLNPHFVATSYFWSTGSTDSSITVVTSGNYWVEVNVDGCKKKDTVKVTFFPVQNLFIGNDTILCSDTATFLLKSNITATKYLWSTGQTTSSIQVSETNNYSLTVTDNHSCKAADSVDIVKLKAGKDIIMPNVFTPNNDGKNEVFMPFDAQYADYKLTIYNRWGNLITENIQQWDGSNEKDKEAKESVYFYIVEYTNDCTKSKILTKAGYVELLK